MGGAQPLAITMNGGICLDVEVESSSRRKRLDIGHVDFVYTSLDEALGNKRSKTTKKAVIIGLIGNATYIYSNC